MYSLEIKALVSCVGKAIKASINESNPEIICWKIIRHRQLDLFPGGFRSTVYQIRKLFLNKVQNRWKNFIKWQTQGHPGSFTLCGAKLPSQKRGFEFLPPSELQQQQQVCAVLNFKLNSDLSSGLSEDNIEVRLNTLSVNSTALKGGFVSSTCLQICRVLWSHPVGRAHKTPELNYNATLIQVKQYRSRR